MSQSELLRRVVGSLDQLRIPYMITGSLASSLYGEPRATHDIDLVVSLPAGSLEAVVAALQDLDHYVDPLAVEEAVRRRDMFNLIDMASGDKVDFWLLTEEDFDRIRFERRRTEVIHGASFQVSSAEDTILAKLRWAKLSGGSEKQFGDALRVYEVQYGNLDLEYLSEWVGRLGVEALWERLRSEAQVL